MGYAISKFFELKKSEQLQSLDLDTFIHGGRLENFGTSCRSIHSSQGKMLVKKLYKHEHLQETIQNLFKELDLTGNPQLPRAKSTLRTDKRHYRDRLSPGQAKTIEHIFAQENEWGQYQL